MHYLNYESEYILSQHNLIVFLYIILTLSVLMNKRQDAINLISPFLLMLMTLTLHYLVFSALRFNIDILKMIVPAYPNFCYGYWCHWDNWLYCCKTEMVTIYGNIYEKLELQNYITYVCNERHQELVNLISHCFCRCIH